MQLLQLQLRRLTLGPDLPSRLSTADALNMLKILCIGIMENRMEAIIA